MTRTLQLTSTETAAWEQVPEGGTFWLVGEGEPECSLGWECDDTTHDGRCGEARPPAEFVQACAPCGTCEDGCDIASCPDCGLEYTDPCARHLAAGHHPSADPYGDMVDCGGCCPNCRIELMGPCPDCDGTGNQSMDPTRCCWNCGGNGTITLSFAYAVGEPLPIVLCGSGHGLVGEYVVVENARVFCIKNDEFPVESEELTDAFAHYGDPSAQVGKYAMRLRRVS